MNKPKTERHLDQERVAAILALASRRAERREEYNQLAEKLSTTPYTHFFYLFYS
ncbi:hypothetical protein [Ktedonobacter robiniae]|uniref:hypothetical protein n=1 Tax=Ktedonobacter robiniae TaxID=2778365 RepID=UPI001915CEA2|nr:hypothetical protein [Ktedonobacter robiniae]